MTFFLEMVGRNRYIVFLCFASSSRRLGESPFEAKPEKRPVLPSAGRALQKTVHGEAMHRNARSSVRMEKPSESVIEKLPSVEKGSAKVVIPLQCYTAKSARSKSLRASANTTKQIHRY
jgi:hypothetical protein